MSEPAPSKLARQRRTVTIIGIGLIVVGAAILLLLRKPPVALRMMAGLGDIFMGCVLLVLVRQRR
jgi:uncharacterized membrane protein HdeD (DUF308 family)